ncbi:hypothetical protein D3C81_2311930 [compost metagenome]
MYTKCNSDGRRQKMHYIRSNLSKLSLAQWKGLTRGAWDVLTPLLMKHDEL